MTAPEYPILEHLRAARANLLAHGVGTRPVPPGGRIIKVRDDGKGPGRAKQGVGAKQRRPRLRGVL